MSTGDKAAGELDYIALPDAVKAMIRKEWGGLKDATGETAYKQERLVLNRLLRMRGLP